MAQRDGRQYSVGKGRLYFEQFVDGSMNPINGELYFGNTPELMVTQSDETLDHYDAESGFNVKDEQITIQKDMMGSFGTDNISMENITLFFTGDREATIIVAAVGEQEVVTAALGRHYQLGKSAEMPSGARGVSNVVITKPAVDPLDPAVTVALAGNVDVDLALGRIYIESDAPDVLAGDLLTITYDVVGGERDIVIGKGKEVRGALRFIADNPIGPNDDHFWPYVKLTPNGDYALKSSEWKTMSFSFEVLKKDSGTDRVYVDRRAAV